MTHVDALIVGGGFGGALGARSLQAMLRSTGHRGVLVSPTNFMLFSPLLPEAASGTIEPRHAVIPLREMLKGFGVRVGTVVAFDPVAKSAVAEDLEGNRHEITFEVALLAPGSIPAVFPIPGLIENAVGFKTLADAIWLRNRVLHQIDAAQGVRDLRRRRELLTFTFVGGGYAGVEALAEVESLARDAVKRYQDLSIGDFRWVLIEAEESLLPGLNPRLARYTERNLRGRGVELVLSTRLIDSTDRIIRTDPEHVMPYHSETIVWTTGQRPAPVDEAWGLPGHPEGGVAVDAEMRVRGFEGVYAIGDFAAVPDPEGGIAPNTAQHALRQAHVAAANMAKDLGIGNGATYDYRTRGLAVTLGKRQGTAQVRNLTFTGPLAWWMGRSYHLLMMPGFGRKARVVTDWTLSLFFPRDIAQLGSLGAPSPLG
jgi:NADH dehydrogenase